MGIGIAFATGFLKGHTDYTKEQAAAAQKEKEAPLAALARVSSK